MKKLNIVKDSLIPFWMKDLEYMQSGMEEAIKVIIESLSLTDKNIIISGCEITMRGGYISMTSGWCYYEGEILPVRALPSAKCSLADPMIIFGLVDSYDASGDRYAIKNNENQNVSMYQNRYINPRLENNSGSVDLGIYNLGIKKGAWNLADRLRYSSMAADSGMVKVDIDGYAANVHYRMIGGVVQLYGAITNEDFGGGLKVKVATGLPCPACEVVIGECRISASGELTIVSSQDSVRLDNILYLATPEYPTDDKHYSNKPIM